MNNWRQLLPELEKSADDIVCQLKELESKGYIIINRGSINIIDSTALQSIADA